MPSGRAATGGGGSKCNRRAPRTDGYFSSLVLAGTVLDRTPYRLGLGTYSLTDEAGIEAMVSAIEAGYRHLDTARLYGNESEVGEAIDRAAVDREDLFVATKVAHFEEPEPTPEYVREAVAESKRRLGVDTIDLLYHHWRRDTADIETVLPVIEELVEAGDVDRLGVSNYTADDLAAAADLVDVPIVANQIEMHPLLPQRALRQRHRERDVTTVAYSPLAQGAVFETPEIVEVADEYDTSPAVVSLAWLLSKGDVVPIPRSSSPEHIRANRTALELDLDEADLRRIDSIERTVRCEDPDWMAW